MKWNVAAPFFKPGSPNFWIDDYVNNSPHVFEKIARPNSAANLSWHNKKKPITTVSEWASYLLQGNASLNDNAEGVITVFPQLAATVGIKKFILSSRKPVVAWCFNLGKLYQGARGLGSRVAFNKIDKFIVHSRRERDEVARWLGISTSRVDFFPLQRAQIPIYAHEDVEEPFVLSMGSANRDYETFFQAVKELNIKTIVVAGGHALSGLDIPGNVEVRQGLSVKDCHILSQRARVNVVPVLNVPTGAGQITIVEAMTMGRAVVSTRCVGSEDYINNGVTGFLVKPSSVSNLKSSISDLWFNESLRQKISAQAGDYAKNNFSDEAAAKNLLLTLNNFV